jgi:hypothetical protein
LGILRIFSQLYFERAIAYSLCASFVTGICLFIERDVSCVILRGSAAVHQKKAAIAETTDAARPKRMPTRWKLAQLLLPVI